jgi:hypothetical protein
VLELYSKKSSGIIGMIAQGVASRFHKTSIKLRFCGILAEKEGLTAWVFAALRLEPRGSHPSEQKKTGVKPVNFFAEREDYEP